MVTDVLVFLAAATVGGLTGIVLARAALWVAARHPRGR